MRRIEPLYLVLYFLLSGSLFGCRAPTLSASELERYIADPAHGLTHRQTIGDVSVTVTYYPASLLAYRELLTGVFPKEQWDSLQAAYAYAQYYQVAFARHGQEVLSPSIGMEEYSALLQTISFQLSDHVHLLNEQRQEIPLQNYSVDRTYAMGDASYVLLAFATHPTGTTYTLHIQELGLGTGDLPFYFAAKDLEKVPALLP